MQGSDQFRSGRRRPAFMGIFIIGGILLTGAVVMLLWNAILPEVTSFKPIGYWQALGLFALCRLLFGGFGFRGAGRSPRFGRRHFRERFMRMSDEERAAFRARWEEHCRKD